MRQTHASLILLAWLALAGPACSQGALAGGAATADASLPVVVPASSVARPEDAGLAAHTNTRVVPAAAIRADVARRAAALQSTGQASNAIRPMVGQPPYAGYAYETPASLACVYGLVPRVAGCNPNSLTAVATGGSRAIAIVVAYHYPDALGDLQTASTQFGLAAPNLSVFFATAGGACNGGQPALNAGWAGEAALDLQMAHSAAPQAKLILVEAQSNNNADLLGAVQCANTQLAPYGGGEVTMSWGGAEFAGQTTLDATYFSAPNVVYFAATGDAPGVNWPATSARVVAVGGASHARGVGANLLRLTSWSEAGGGSSVYVGRPAYQNAISTIVGARRGVPDIAAVANPETGVWVYFTTANVGGWYVYGGTSVSAPLMAGIVNAAGVFRASTTAELTALYAAKAVSDTDRFFTIGVGYCGPRAGYYAQTAWNFCTGVGAPRFGLTPLRAQQ